MAAGEIGNDVLRFRGVVEDEEPVLGRPEPLLDRGDDGGLVGKVFFLRLNLIAREA